MPNPRPPTEPSERQQTLRQSMLERLRKGASTAKDLSGLLGIREKDVAAHLQHLARSLRSSGERLQVEPAECLSCGYVFADRSRLTRPSACPQCRAQRIEPPVFSVVSEDGT